MIRCEGVSFGALHAVSFAVDAGESAKVLLASDAQRRDLMRVLGGLAAPVRGSVYLFDQSLYDLEPVERVRLFRRVGIVLEGGGLISNLKVWENVLLPAAFHTDVATDSAEPRVLAIFRELGLEDADTAALMARLPDTLPVHEKRFAALARAMLTDGDVLIYDYLFSGLERAAASRILEATAAFHGRKPGRVSLYVCADDAFADKLAADRTIRVK